jgi:hypothetical protein
MYKKWSVLVLAAAVTFAAVAPALGDRGNPNPRVLPINSKPYGKSYGEWGSAYEQWLESIPVPENPMFDLTGEFAGVGQSGPVWFLGCVAAGAGATVDWTFTVPAGKALFIPISLSGWVNFPEYGDAPWSPEQEAFVRSLLAEFMDNPGPMACEIDGVEFADITGYRFQTPVGGAYMITLPDYNLWDLWYGFDVPAGTYGPCVDDGYFLMLAPLPAGAHTIHVLVGDPATELTYHITVQ